VSLLLGHGHQGATEYPVGVVWIEARLVRRRLRQALADEAVMLHAVIVGALANPKHLQSFLKELDEDGD